MLNIKLTQAPKSSFFFKFFPVKTSPYSEKSPKEERKPETHISYQAMKTENLKRESQDGKTLNLNAEIKNKI